MESVEKRNMGAGQEPDTENCAVEVKELVKTYGRGETAVRALKGCSISFARGGFTVITGTSGSGKTTLLNLIGGLDQADSGSIVYGSDDLMSMDDTSLSRFRRRKLGFVFQFFNLVPELTAEENILLPIRIDGRKPDRKYLMETAEKLGITGRLHHYPSQLSGGQQQRAAIARAVINRPEVILCDEPTGNLDKKTGEEVISLLMQLKEESGQTIIMVTHDMEIASRADRIIRIEDGRII